MLILLHHYVIFALSSFVDLFLNMWEIWLENEWWNSRRRGWQLSTGRVFIQERIQVSLSWNRQRFLRLWRESYVFLMFYYFIFCIEVCFMYMVWRGSVRKLSLKKITIYSIIKEHWTPRNKSQGVWKRGKMCKNYYKVLLKEWKDLSKCRISKCMTVCQFSPHYSKDWIQFQRKAQQCLRVCEV